MNRIEGGIRLKGISNGSKQLGWPVISIITVVYNNKAALEKTITSVLSQTYKNIEYIIIDGGSTDSTTDLLRSYENSITYWLSEKDAGIYDAMNKGLMAATGEYVWFINAGDQIPGIETVRSIIKNDPMIDIYYGDAMVVDENDQYVSMRRLRPPKRLTWRSLGMGMVVCHQSILIRRSLARPYKLQYRIAADFEWVLNALKKSSVIQNTGKVLIKYLWDGFSRHHVPLSLKERLIIMVKNYGLIKTLYFHFLITIRLIPSFSRKLYLRFFPVGIRTTGR